MTIRFATILRHKVLRVIPQNEDQVRSLRELLQRRNDVSAKNRSNSSVWVTFGSDGTNVAPSVRRALIWQQDGNVS